MVSDLTPSELCWMAEEVVLALIFTLHAVNKLVKYINTMKLTDERRRAPNELTAELLPWNADICPKPVDKGGSGDLALQDPLRLCIRKLEPLHMTV